MYVRDESPHSIKEAEISQEKIADWNAGICVDLTNAEEIENYIKLWERLK